jgi:hypothetical protein
MKLVMYLVPGADYNPRFKCQQSFQDNLEKTARRKLMMLDHDIIEIHGVMDEVNPLEVH